MPLAFPIVQDIPLGRAPLREVICQVRFPTMLRIAEEKPVHFQERIRDRFPALDVEHGVVIESEGTKPGPSIELRPAVYRFHDPSEVRAVGLAPDFYALSTQVYQHWVGFADDLRYITEAVCGEYDIPYATRIGLRYINVIDASFTPTGEFAAVYDLLRPELTVMLRTDVVVSPDYAMQRMHVAADNGEFAFRYGLIHEGEVAEPKFVLDFDYYVEGSIGLDDLLTRCDHYHQVIYRAFRWCIADSKLAAFEPLPAT